MTHLVAAAVALALAVVILGSERALGRLRRLIQRVRRRR